MKMGFYHDCHIDVDQFGKEQLVPEQRGRRLKPGPGQIHRSVTLHLGLIDRKVRSRACRRQTNAQGTASRRW